MTFRPRRDVSQTTVYEASGSELVAISTSLHLVFNNVVHRHFPWFKAKTGTPDSAVPHQYAVPEIGATESDDEPIMCVIHYQRVRIEVLHPLQRSSGCHGCLFECPQHPKGCRAERSDVIATPLLHPHATALAARDRRSARW